MTQDMSKYFLSLFQISIKIIYYNIVKCHIMLLRMGEILEYS
jgi:hypothetical protein